MKSEMLTAEDISQFKALFRKYCRGEINAERCSDDSCELCFVNKAYMEIFDSLEEDDDSEDEVE